ncbi:MAG: endonuclease/exonuclease/phosphatase family protein [Planctomycetia bacterium]|nr:endonuclease/exonuclease/phosphatase family protein [Planctomycetia bacterium]
MRLITWNCHHGNCDERAAELDILVPDIDIVVLQECKQPEIVDSDRIQWFGELPDKGVAVIARGKYHLERASVDPTLTHSVFPVHVRGSASFNLLAIHAWKRPTYVEAIDRGVTTYSDFLRSGTSLMAGDFNSHRRFDKKYPKLNHSMLVDRLGREFGLTSAYHSFRDGDEEPTYYHHWNDTKPFHLDYCFVPTAMVRHISEVKVAKFDDWRKRSDHHPVVVDIDLVTALA